MKPVFSIITVTYNAADWIKKTIESVICQTYREIEYIIVDGGSTDGTVDILNKYSNRISQFISEPDNGLYDAMNKGLSLATGDYVWFLNAGDLIYNDGIVGEIVNLISDEGELPDILYGETVLIDKRGDELGLRRLKAPEQMSWKSFKMGMLVSHQSFVVKRQIAPDYDMTYKYSADVDWCIKCMKASNSIYNTYLVLSRYLDEGMTTVNRKASLKERYQIMCKYYGTLPTSLRHLWFAIRFYSAKIIGKKV